MIRSAVAAGALLLFPALSIAQPDPPTKTTITEGTPAPARYRAKEILGATVNIAGNTKVGVVDDFVLDEAGNVEYVLVLSPEKTMITVPWSAAVFDFPRRTAVIDITQERFGQIPTYTVDKYPTFSSPAYRTQIDQYYGMTPDRRRYIKRGNPGIVK